MTVRCFSCLRLFVEAQIAEMSDRQYCLPCLAIARKIADIGRERAATNGRPSGRSAGPTHARRQTADDERPADDADRHGREWYAVAVFGGDRKAARTIKDWIGKKCPPRTLGRVLVPRAHQEVVRGGKVVSQYRKATPGYLLVQINPDELFTLKRCPQVATVLPYSDPIDADKYERMVEEGEPIPHPVAVPKEEVEPFLRKTPKPVGGTVRVGDRVRVRAGSWEGQEGRVTAKDGDQVSVEVTILGRPAVVSEPATNVERLAEGA